MFTIFSLILLLNNFFSSGLFYDIAIFFVDNFFLPTQDTINSYYPSTTTSDLHSIYNQNNFIIESWKLGDQSGIVKIMNTDHRKFFWHNFDWYQFPPFFESNGVLKNINQWSCELFKTNNSNELTSFQREISNLLYHKYYFLEFIKV